MEPKSIFKKNYTIGLSDVDFLQNLKISSLFGYFQDIASDHADNLGFGIDEISSNHGVTWVLIKIKVEIERMPVWNEEITLETWPQKPKRFEFERDYVIKDSEGRTIIKAISTWVIMDIKNRELRKTELIEVNYPAFIQERAIDGKMGKLKASGEPQIAYKKTIGYSDIDMNEHINNSRYIDYIMDCFPVEEHKKYKVKSIQVNYINEALPGVTLTMYSDTSGSDTIFIEGINDSNSSQVFSSQIEICERQ